MTLEPTGGYYKTAGVEAFIRKYGYPDMTGQAGREDRLNFGGIHRIDSYHERTGLSIILIGYDREAGKIRDATGGIALMNLNGEEAAVWRYTEIMRHWNRKHAQAVYIPSMSKKIPDLRYRYGNLVRLGMGTDFLLYLKAISAGHIYYDPGIKLENASTVPRTKRRSQFRIKSTYLPTLYHEMKTVDLLAGY
ncbi:MAG: MvaI/BcnI family restriction endonuclease [Syntrophales bacterium]